MSRGNREFRHAKMGNKPLAKRTKACYKRHPLSLGRRANHFWIEYMSQHRSLRAVATVGGKRNVLKRFERVGLLKKRGQWKDGDRITGLRKTKADS
jgi:small basic protein (TIGR04137 family)